MEYTIPTDILALIGKMTIEEHLTRTSLLKEQVKNKELEKKLASIEKTLESLQSPKPIEVPIEDTNAP